MRVVPLVVALLASCVSAAAEDLWQGRSAAFFGTTFIDTSSEGERFGAREDEAARTAMVETDVAEAFEAHGVTLLDLAPVATDLRRIVNPADCYGCDLRMAARLGADYAVVSEVQKVSNLILAMNVEVREVATGRRVRGLAVDIRGNTDESWSRGVRYILERGIFTD